MCRFLVRNIQGGLGYASADYRIELIKERHGLYDLVSSVFDILLREGLTHDSITSHLWKIQFAKRVYRNGWRHCRISDFSYDRPANDTDIDEVSCDLNDDRYDNSRA